MSFIVCITLEFIVNYHNCCLQTDGLSDNVFPREVLALSSLVMRANETPDQLAQTLADRLCLFATQSMWDRRRVSPFEGTPHVNHTGARSTRLACRYSGRATNPMFVFIVRYSRLPSSWWTLERRGECINGTPVDLFSDVLTKSTHRSSCFDRIESRRVSYLLFLPSSLLFFWHNSLTIVHSVTAAVAIVSEDLWFITLLVFWRM